MTDERYEMASKLAKTIAICAEELSTAIYEAHKMGYRTAVRVENVVTVSTRDGALRCIGGDDERAVNVYATIPFDVGRAVL